MRFRTMAAVIGALLCQLVLSVVVVSQDHFSPQQFLQERKLGLLSTRTPQSDKPLQPIAARSLAEWQSERLLYEKAFRELIGSWPDKRPGLQSKILETHTTDRWTRHKVVFSSVESKSDHVRIYAWLFVPAGEAAPKPAIITLHQTVPQGKHEPAGIQSTLPWLEFAKYYAERGYVTLAPDMIGFGERTTGGYARTGFEWEDARPVLDEYREMTLLGWMLWDVSRCFDFLETRPEVDPQRIGVIGHSLGGILTNCVMPLEPRCRVAVASCGYGLFRTDAEFNGRWAAHNSAYLPRMVLYQENRDALPLDFHHILALSAPRPHLIQTAMGDTIWTLPGVGQNEFVTRELQRVRSFYGPAAVEDLVAIEPADGARDRNHGWYPETQQAADKLLERVLKP